MLLCSSVLMVLQHPSGRELCAGTRAVPQDAPGAHVALLWGRGFFFTPLPPPHFPNALLIPC